MVKADHIQIRLGGQAVVVSVPLGLIKIGALDPLTLGRFRRPSRQLADDLSLAGAAAQIHRGVGLAVGKEVEVGIAHTRKHGLSLQIHNLRGFAVSQHLLRRSSVYNLTVTNGQCFHHAVFAHHGVYCAVF